MEHPDTEKLDGLYWHDGLLDDIRVSINEGRSTVFIKVRLYNGHDSPSRYIMELVFTDPLSCVITCDLQEILANHFAGTIEHGLSKPNNKSGIALRIFLVDGYIDVVGNRKSRLSVEIKG